MTDQRHEHDSERKQDYKLARTTVLGFDDPLALRELTFADACRRTFAEPLIAGGDPLLKIWRELIEKAIKKSSYPDDTRKYFEERMASADKFKFARDEVITGGWWNCANARIKRGDADIILDKNFRKLFRRVKQLGCDYA